jgi:hypothetical protein
MYIELVDQLRCLQPHASSWLVAYAERMSGRDVMDGTLGCPVCAARYEVRDGVAFFGASTAVESRTPSAAPADGEVERAAALLGLAEPGGFVLLEAEWSALAHPLAALTGTHAVALNPTDAVAAGDGVSVIVAPPGALPFATGALRSAALGADAHPELGERVAHALRARGRLVAPASAALPAGTTELARDQRHWVAERGDVASAPVPLALARRSR